MENGSYTNVGEAFRHYQVKMDILGLTHLVVCTFMFSCPQTYTHTHTHMHACTHTKSHQIKVEDEEWFFGNIDRALAESKCKMNGDYLVRYSTRLKKYVLTFRISNQPRHFVIPQITDVS